MNLKTIGLLSCLLVGLNSLACLHADQNRIFPIGQSSKGLHVLEIHQSRDDEDFKPLWRCVAYHKIYNEKQEVKQSDSIQTMGYFPEGNYIKVIQSLFGKAQEIAKTNKTLKYLAPKSLYFCDYDRENTEAKLSFDITNDHVFVQLKSGKKHKITVLNETHWIGQDLLNALGSIIDYEPINFAQFLQQSLCVNSVRKFMFGQKQLTIVHLGIGQEFSDEDGNFPKPSPYFSKEPFNSIFNSIFFENVLHHGYGFDFMIWE